VGASIAITIDTDVEFFFSESGAPNLRCPYEAEQFELKLAWREFHNVVVISIIRISAYEQMSVIVFLCIMHFCNLTINDRIFARGMVWCGMVNVDLYSAIITKVSNALNMLVSGEKPGFQALSKGLIVLLCTEVVRQGVPDHGAVHSECSAYYWVRRI